MSELIDAMRLGLLLLLLNFGLKPEQNAMNTLLDISEMTARELGRPELVADYNGGNFTPTPTFLRSINAAHQHLDRRYSHQDREVVSPISIAQGDWKHSLPAGVKYIRRIDLVDAAGNIIPNGGLDRRTLAFLRDYYGQTFDLVPEAQPVFWARGTISPIPKNLVRYDDLGPFSGIAPDINGPTGIGVTYGDAQDYPLEFDGDVVVFNTQIHLKLVDPGGFVLPQIPPPIHFSVTLISGSMSVSGVPLEIGNPIFPGTYEWVYDTPQSLIQITGGGVLRDLKILSSSASGPEAFVGVDLITMPPSDKPYTANVYHAQYAEPMAANTDVSWWSDKHPDILVLAIKRQIAINNRNRTEVKEYDEDLEPALFDLETDTAMEHQESRKPIEFRFGWRP